MKTQTDFLEWLEPDVALKILTCLDDAPNLVHACAVSRCWQTIVVSNGLTKQLCMRAFPPLASIIRVVEPNHENFGETERDHRVYASILRALTAFALANCIPYLVSASSTHHYPEEGIINTMVPMSTFLRQGSYWSSKGTNDAETPETLKLLVPCLCAS